MPTLDKRTAKNQLTRTKPITDQFPAVDYLEVTAEGDRIVLQPVRLGQADEVRERLAEAGTGPQDVDDAIRTARRQHP